MAKKIAHGAARPIHQGLAGAIRRKPGPVRPRDIARKIGHHGDHCRAPLSPSPVVGLKEAARMISQGVGVPDGRDAAMHQIGLGEGPANWLGHGD